MKKITIVGVELGMLLGIVSAAFLIPSNTPLSTFAAIGGAFWLETFFSAPNQVQSKWRR